MRVLFIFAFVLSLFVSSLSAQSLNVGSVSGSSVSVGSVSGSSVSGDLDLKSVFADKVQNLSFSFCDDTKAYFDGSKILYIARPAQTKGFCGNLSSRYSSGLTVKYAFVNASLTDRKTIVCDQSLSTGDISYFPSYQNIVYPLAPGFSLTFHERIHLPTNQTGTHYFCFVYWVDEEKKDKERYINGMFDIVVRKSIPIQVTAFGKKYPFQWWDDLIWDIKNKFFSKK